MTYIKDAKVFFSDKSVANIATWLDQMMRSVHDEQEKDVLTNLVPMEAWYGRNDSYLDDLSAMCRESFSPLEQEKFNLGIALLIQRYAALPDTPLFLVEDAVDLVGRLPALEAAESIYILLRDRAHAIPTLWYDVLSAYATLSPAGEIVDPLYKLVGLAKFPANYAIYAFQYLCEARPSAWLEHWRLISPKLEALEEMANKEDPIDPVINFAVETLERNASEYLGNSNIDLTIDRLLSEVILHLSVQTRNRMRRQKLQEIALRQGEGERHVGSQQIGVIHRSPRIHALEYYNTGRIYKEINKTNVPNDLRRRVSMKLEELSGSSA